MLRQYLTMLKQRSKDMVEFLREDLKFLNDMDAIIRDSNVSFDHSLDGRLNELKDLIGRYEVDENQRLYLMEFMFELVELILPLSTSLTCLSVNIFYLFREEARNLWRSHEERWKSEYVIRKIKVEELFTTIKIQVSVQQKSCWITFQIF